MFGRKKTINDAQASELHEDRPGAKNRPTPKRRDQEAARKKPLVVTDRKAARASAREHQRIESAKRREAMMNGDERALPPRDKGPVKRFCRDWVDARWSVGEFMLPIMMIVLLMSLLQQKNPTIMLIVFIAVYGLIALVVIDCVITWRRLKKALRARFGADVPLKGCAWYTAMRACQLRRTRMPRPKVERGTKLV